MPKVDTKCPKCGTEIENPEDHNIVECPKCCLPGSTFCCNVMGSGCLCVECESIEVEKPKTPTIRQLFLSYCKTYGLNPKKLTPAEAFAGNCYPVAHELAHLMGKPAIHVRGHWLGPDCREAHSKRAATQHSWVECGDWWMDPTRFVFEGVEPYIHIVCKDCDPFYDHCSRKFRKAMGATDTLPPRKRPLKETGLSAGARLAISVATVRRNWKLWSEGEMFRIGNADPVIFGGHAHEIFAAIYKQRPAIIPIDTFEYLFPEETVNPREVMKRLRR
jgi:hypothetical protein